MSRYIDADKLLEKVHALELPHPYGGEYHIDIIHAYDVRNAPTADVVEVVRCKDCKHWGGTTYGFVCRKFSGIDTKICMGADHYCSYGEGREE